ncbi:hypothetical protein DV515_00005378, partial [Chloebia gouldiae]
MPRAELRHREMSLAQRRKKVDSDLQQLLPVKGKQYRTLFWDYLCVLCPEKASETSGCHLGSELRKSQEGWVADFCEVKSMSKCHECSVNGNSGYYLKENKLEKYKSRSTSTLCGPLGL